MPASVLITGANRGIGLGFVKQVLQWKDLQYLFACCRNPTSAKELNAISTSDKRVHVVQMDVVDESSVINAAAQVSDILGEIGLNLLINNAGILESGDRATWVGAQQDCFLRHFSVNSVAPVIVSKEFLPLLELASKNYANPESFGIDRAAIINISSMLGSIGDNTSGSKFVPNLAYRASKAALNQVTRTISVDLVSKKILVASFCPGWVKTDMGSSAAQLEVFESTSQLCETFLKLNAENNGQFLDRTGKIMNF
ncbi:hypothetical protein QR680_002312 [Steinernema hermaphroditum]|uniref:C-factor n=1 Tax=Steinernema hermaphroditum TaxID=289476 RepID=A0AA39H348_9BILA|nr:hypothetical protein QR680_002312 [Steinernema hermaphroditum]